MIVKVFLLGRPGSGKTTAFHHIETMVHNKRQKAIRFREYGILRDMFRAGRKEFQPVEHGGFDVLDFSVLNESADLLEKQVQEYIHIHQDENEFLFLELARDNYQHAMKCFSSIFLRDAYFLFVEADIETCLRRIYCRLTCAKKTDGHFISEHIIRGYYGKDNKDYMKNDFKIDHGLQREVTVIENQGSLKEFMDTLTPFAHTILGPEVVTQKLTRGNTSEYKPLHELQYCPM